MTQNISLGNRVNRLPFLLGRLIGKIFPFGRHEKLFFFFPCCHIGGAEKVHARIASIFADHDPVVFFVNKSQNKIFLSLFPDGIRIFNVSIITKYYSFALGFFVSIVSKSKDLMLFGSNNSLFYDIVYSSKPLRSVDLIHAFGEGIEIKSLKAVSKLDARIVVTETVKNKLLDLYEEHGVSKEYWDRINVVGNGTYIPQPYNKMINITNRLKVLYVGRGTPEKRVDLIGKIAARCKEKLLRVDFAIVGDISEVITDDISRHCVIHGPVTLQDELGALYKSADLLILTSEREGFPLVIMEAMAYGVVPVSTDVGGISDHITHFDNGVLISETEKERVVLDFCKVIEQLDSDRNLLSSLSISARSYAEAHFAFTDVMNNSYRKLVLGCMDTNE
ncbi:D-inositol 3-phosphate glycosyltransferase [Geobacter sp. OR-1]|uniref:glycosyltransferase family 4 protein n=1 Tax=Geobacter sp. OR-1 TaxID=1266765 RepID=UPI0005426B74|nr:glycosyltransferase family 4 protein [Geobacter sp. OR-1]GAM11538.1 D-inositol 3-phosphate glycosyltransferase [Geobacter sp. OR-1]